MKILIVLVLICTVLSILNNVMGDNIQAVLGWITALMWQLNPAIKILRDEK